MKKLLWASIAVSILALCSASANEYAPSGGTTIASMQPTFTWPAVSGATWYELDIQQVDGWTWSTWVGDSNTTYTPSGWSLANASYRWRVRGWGNTIGYGGWSDDAEFTVNVPVVMSPGGGETTTDTTPQFTWTAVTGASWYQVYLEQIGGWQWSTWVNDQNTWTPPGWTFTAGTYKWYVRAWGQSIGYTSWRGPETFTVEVPPPAKPALIAPQGTVTSPRPTFSWNALEGVNWYQVFIQQQGGWDWGFWLRDTPTWTSTFDFPDGTYQWWVRGYGQDYTLWSDGMTFTVDSGNSGESPDLNGTWVGNWDDTQCGGGNPDALVHSYMAAGIVQTGSTVTMTMYPENDVYIGTISGNTFTVSEQGSDHPETYTGTYDSGSNSITGTWNEPGEYQDEGDCQGTFALSKAGTDENIAGSWTFSYQDHYDSSGNPEQGQATGVFTQTGTVLTLVLASDDGYTDTFQGVIKGDTFVLSAGGVDWADDLAGEVLEDGSLQGASEWDEWSEDDNWGWGTFTAQRQ